MSKKIAFRDLHQYKYQLMRRYTQKLDKIRPIKDVWVGNWIGLKKDGTLIIKKGYCWDGPSGPTIDTNTFMRGSLIHDALYQLMRAKKIGLAYRDYVDELLGKTCKEDGMIGFRAWYVKKLVNKFGKGSAIPQKSEPKIRYAP